MALTSIVDRVLGRFGWMRGEDVQSLVATASQAAAHAAAADAVNTLLLANPTLGPHLQQQGGAGGFGYEPLDQNFSAYMASCGLFSILSACDEAIATTCASSPLHLWRERDGDNPEEITDHPLLELFSDPNPEQGFYQWWHEGHLNNGRTGNVYLVAVSERTPAVPFANPDELWFADSGRMRPIFAKQLRRGRSTPIVTGYDFDNGAATYRPEEVLHIKRPNPRDPAIGLSPYKELETTLNLLYGVYQEQRNYFQNGSRPGLIFRQVRGPKPAQALPGTDVVDRFREQVESGHAGVKNAGRNLYLSPFWELLNTAGDTAEDARYVEAAKFLREDILAVRGVPPFAIGLLEHANWSNSREQKGFFYTRTVIPTNRMFLDAINTHHLVRVWQRPGERLYFDFDYSAVEGLNEDTTAKWERLGSAWDRGALTLDEYRAGIGLGPVGGEEGESRKPAPVPSVSFGAMREQMGAPGRALSRMLAVEAPDENTRRAIQWDGAQERKRPIIRAYMRRFRPLLRKLWIDVESKMESMAGSGLSSYGLAFDPEAQPVPPGWNDQTWIDLVEALRLWIDESKDLADLTVRAGAEDAAVDVLGEVVPFDTTRPDIAAVIRERTGIGIKGMLETQIEAIRDEVRRAVRDGVTVGELTTKIREIGRGRERWWAERIARTETQPLYNTGFLSHARELGANSKEWLSARDDKTRPMHREMDGQSVAIDANFSAPDGYAGPSPGMMGAAHHDINCRCAANVGVV